ncbi:hypothetical protein B0H13DRAFT_2314180 [Mycena leptocephala]|nr:hypothetical protein B0H13DRAFT_2314180 [Mycena leptocephala]
MPPACTSPLSSPPSSPRPPRPSAGPHRLANPKPAAHPAPPMYTLRSQRRFLAPHTPRVRRVSSSSDSRSRRRPRRVRPGISHTPNLVRSQCSVLPLAHVAFSRLIVHPDPVISPPIAAHRSNAADTTTPSPPSNPVLAPHAAAVPHPRILSTILNAAVALTDFGGCVQSRMLRPSSPLWKCDSTFLSPSRLGPVARVKQTQ